MMRRRAWAVCRDNYRVRLGFRFRLCMAAAGWEIKPPKHKGIHRHGTARLRNQRIDFELDEATGMVLIDAPGEDVDDEGDVLPGFPRRHVSEVRDPELVRMLGAELRVDLVERTWRLLVTDRWSLHQTGGDSMPSTWISSARTSRCCPRPGRTSRSSMARTAATW